MSKKLKVSVFLMVVIFWSQTFIITSFTAADAAVDELPELRKNIRTVDDINAGVYARLEAIMLQKFPDIKKDSWYMSVMTKLFGLSSLDGTGRGMEPNGTITRAMFIKMFIRAMYGTDFLDDVTPDFDHWAAGDIKKAEQVEILATGQYTPDNISEPITRGEMAKLIVRAYRQFEPEPLSHNDCKPLASRIKDYNQIPVDYRPYVLITYGAGIINGYPDGSFRANSTATRAEASAFIIRYLDPGERFKIEIPDENDREPMTLRYDDPHRPMAIEGDTFIKPDGTSVVLKVGPSGVLGEMQGAATEIGRIDRGGTPLKEGDLGTEEDFLGQPYLVDEKTGEGHYQSEWDEIAERLFDEAIENIGHPADGTTYGPWLLYKWGCWNWVGP